MNIIYLRVSKEEETLQDLESQKKAILEKFSPLNPQILEERGSAYSLEKMYKRRKFLSLINSVFNAKQVTINDIFLGNYKKKEVNIYVWDYHRIMRNIEYGLFFGLLCDLFNVTIYSYKDGRIEKKEEETPSDKLVRYIRWSISAFSGEDYSYHTSLNIKKVIGKESGLTVSKKPGNEGTKWGRKFVNLKGEKVDLEAPKTFHMNKRILALIKYHKKQTGDPKYSLVIEKIGKEWGIKISKAYISGLKKKDLHKPSS